MPLSEQEQRLLEEMERSLYQHDADFVATVSNRSSRPNFRMIVIGLLTGIAGIAGIVTGVATRLPIIGVVGFVVMFVGALVALTRSPGLGPDPDGHDHNDRNHGGFMHRMNERWDKRQEENGS